MGKKHIFPLKHYKRVCCETEMLSYWGGCWVGSISYDFGFLGSLFGHWKETGSLRAQFTWTVFTSVLG